jgi:hypothetical protein
MDMKAGTEGERGSGICSAPRRLVQAYIVPHPLGGLQRHMFATTFPDLSTHPWSLLLRNKQLQVKGGGGFFVSSGSLKTLA